MSGMVPGTGDGATGGIAAARGLTVHRISTESLGPREQYAFWKEVVCGVFVGLDCSRSGQGAFRSSVVQRRFALDVSAEASFIDVASEAQRAVRSPRQIRGASEDWLLLALQTDGAAVLRQGGRDAVLRAGDMVLFDSTRPYEFLFDRPFRQMVVKLPHARLAPRLPRSAAWLGRAVAGASPLGGVLAAHLAAVSDALGRVDPALRPGLIDRTIDLIALAFAGTLRDYGGGGSTVQCALIARARQLVEARLGDPALSAGSVAAMLGISAGYLHRLFHAEGETVGEYIRSRRLERCRRELADPLHAGERITEIALRWGFNDMPHFSRAFRSRFGAAPRDCRGGAVRIRG